MFIPSFVVLTASFFLVFPGLIAIFKSADNSVRFAAPILPRKVPEGQYKNPPEVDFEESHHLYINVHVHDSGRYNAQIVGYETDDRRYTGFVKLGTFFLDIIPKGTDSMISDRVLVDRPEEYCQILGHQTDSKIQAMSHKGRWINCDRATYTSKTGIPIQCLRDGWVWLPFDCVHRIHNSTSLIDHYGPHWIVYSGSSIMRGTAHTTLEVFAEEKVKSIVFPTDEIASQKVSGVGTVEKCWGWLDIEANTKLRISYLDYRDGSMWPNLEASAKRLRNILSHNPTLLVNEIYIGDTTLLERIDSSNIDLDEALHYFNETLSEDQNERFPDDTLVGYMRMLLFNLDVLRTVDTRMILVQQKTSVKKDHWEGVWCHVDQSTSSPMHHHLHQVSIWNRLLTNMKISEEDKQLLRDRVTIWNEDMMIWPFVMDMERKLDDIQAPPRHWHRYVETAHRRVQGIVAEMAAQIYFDALSYVAANASRQHIQTWKERVGRSHDETLRACADCSAKIQFSKPYQEHPVFSLSTQEVVLSKNFTLHSCVAVT